MNQNKHQTEDPFALNPQDYPFLDALLIQCVAGAASLHWESGSGGFFVEVEQLPLAHFEQATLVTGRGKRVAGFAARTCMFYPIASRTVWTMGEPGNRVRVDSYREGAKSRTQVLSMLADGQWAVMTSRGLASQSLSNAFRDHRYQAVQKHKAQPFILPMSGIAGDAELVGSAMASLFKFVTLDERCPDELGWNIRQRWSEVETWLNKAPFNGNDTDNNIDNGSPDSKADPVPDNGLNGKKRSGPQRRQRLDDLLGKNSPRFEHQPRGCSDRREQQRQGCCSCIQIPDWR